MSLTKVSPHLLEVTPAGLDWARRANAVKALDRPDVLAQCKAANPQITTVHRHYFAPQDVNRRGEDVAAEAIDSCHGFVPDFIELFCEIARTPDEGLYRHWEMNGEARPSILAYGSELAGLSLGTGWMEQADWEHVKGQGYFGLKVISLHEYWNGPFDTWNALRHQRVDEWLGPDHPLLWLITECGRDVLKPGDGRGWREQRVSAEQYVQEVQLYNDIIHVERRVIAAFLFCSGATPPHDNEPGFLGFETDGLPLPPTEQWRLWPT